MKSKIIWLGIAIILWTGSYPFSSAQEYNIRVTPRNYNFGKVKLGEESSKSIDISSIQGNYVIANYTFTPNSSPDFRITSTPFSDTVSQGQDAYIEITFKPTSPGRRDMSGQTFEEVTRSYPEPSLTTGLRKRAGRNHLVVFSD